MILWSGQVAELQRRVINGFSKRALTAATTPYRNLDPKMSTTKSDTDSMKTSWTKTHSVEGHANLSGLIVAFVYGVCSASMAFANKAILNSYNFTCQFFLILVQMLITVIVLEILRFSNLISLPAYSPRRGWLFFLPSMFYALHSVLALSALSGMNIPMYGVMKRCAPIVIMLLSMVFFKKGPPSFLVAISVTMITGGCIITGYGDLSYEPVAYMYGGISVVTQSLYLLLVQRCAESLSATETLHLNSYNTLLPLLVGCLVSGEFVKVKETFDIQDTGFVIVFTMVVCMGCALNYLLFLCTTLNSALTTAVTGTLKTIVQTSVGMFTFGGININVCTLSGITFNTAGAILYSYAKFKQIQQLQDETELQECEIKVENDQPDINGTATPIA